MQMSLWVRRSYATTGEWAEMWRRSGAQFKTMVQWGMNQMAMKAGRPPELWRDPPLEWNRREAVEAPTRCSPSTNSNVRTRRRDS